MISRLMHCHLNSGPCETHTHSVRELMAMQLCMDDVISSASIAVQHKHCAWLLGGDYDTASHIWGAPHNLGKTSLPLTRQVLQLQNTLYRQ